NCLAFQHGAAMFRATPHMVKAISSNKKVIYKLTSYFYSIYAPSLNEKVDNTTNERSPKTLLRKKNNA
ncbi:4085_t:CDS:1, partial [Rhizophagus irregularis]